MLLGDLKLFLLTLPQDAVIRHGFGEPRSYRGDYSECAFEPAERVTVASMVAHVERALSGEVFEGYKGGEYTFNEVTPCYIEEWGEWNANAIGPQVCHYWRQEANALDVTDHGKAAVNSLAIAVKLDLAEVQKEAARHVARSLADEMRRILQEAESMWEEDEVLDVWHEAVRRFGEDLVRCNQRDVQGERTEEERCTL